MKEIEVTDIHQVSDKLEVFLFNVGQGDHIMLKFPTLEYGIIDFHYTTSNEIVEPPCLSYFKRLQKILPRQEFEKITISFFCISHTDNDHVKGVVETLKWFDENGIFVRDIWLGAAEDKAQVENVLQKKLGKIIDDAGWQEKFDLSKSFELFDKYLGTFFSYFDNWRNKKFKSPRYAMDPMGSGEYLMEIRSLIRPCSCECDIINVGPLYTQLDSYISGLNLEIIKKILCFRGKTNLIDKNLLSHILRIRFGKTNLLFGGDTHRDIWEECLRKYYNTAYSFHSLYGDLSANFVKLSHHGSRHSSSKDIWKKCVSEGENVFIGISAGHNLQYDHPHSETIDDIRSVCDEAQFLATNFCTQCAEQSGYEIELHSWYDEYIISNLNYDKTLRSRQEKAVTHMIQIESRKRYELKRPGLFAYIFEVSTDPKTNIKVRLAMSKFIESDDSCFYKHCGVSLFKVCSEEATHNN